MIEKELQIEGLPREVMEHHLHRVAGKNSLQYMVNNFGKYADYDEITRFIVRYELFKKVLNLKGSIIECGLRSGTGLMEWYKLSMLLEPHAHLRTVIGFDTFEGFPSVSEEDPNAKVGEMADDSYFDLLKCIELQSQRELKFIPPDKVCVKYPWPRIKIYKGDFRDTCDQYLDENKHAIISLLFLDFDLYDPTKLALQKFRERMPKGAIIAFDEINNHRWPGETKALRETLGIQNHRIEKFPFEMNICWIEL